MFPQSGPVTLILMSSISIISRLLLRLLELWLAGIPLRLWLRRFSSCFSSHLRLDSIRLLVFADGPVVLAPLRRVVGSSWCSGSSAARTYRASVLRSRSLLLLRAWSPRAAWSSLTDPDHVGLLVHAEGPVVLGPLGGVVWLARGGVDLRRTGLRSSRLRLAVLVLRSSVTVTATVLRLLTSVRLAWEGSVTSSGCQSDFFANHLFGSFHAVWRTSDDESFFPRVRGRVFIHLAVRPARLVDGLDGVASLTDNQSCFIGGYRDVLRGLPTTSTTSSSVASPISTR